MRTAWCCTVVVTWLAAGSLASAQDQPPAQAESKLIFGFEGEDELMGMEVTGEHEFVKEKDLVTQGEAAMKLKVKKDAGGGIEFTPMAKKYLIGWDKYDYLVVDVRNLGANRQSLAFRFDDTKTTGQDTRAHVLKTLKPGLNTVKILLKTIVRDNGQPFDIASLNRFIPHFWNAKEDFEVIFDNLRLEKAPPAAPPAK